MRRNAGARAAKCAKLAPTRCNTFLRSLALFISDNRCPPLGLDQVRGKPFSQHALAVRAGFRADTVIADDRPKVGCAKDALADDRWTMASRQRLPRLSDLARTRFNTGSRRTRQAIVRRGRICLSGFPRCRRLCDCTPCNGGRMQVVRSAGSPHGVAAEQLREWRTI